MKLPSAISLASLLVFALPIAVRAASPMSFSGQLIELSSTDTPTTIVVRVNPVGSWTDETVTIDDATKLNIAMDTWITGDTLTVSGVRDASTLVVAATAIQNGSLDVRKERALNGWVKAVDADASTMTLTWQGTDTRVNVTDKTRMVVPPANPAQLSDFQVGDRVRLRLAKGAANEAEIIIALRRGDQVFLKARTRPFRGTVVGTDAERGLFSVRLSADASLRFDDVNNLVGVADEIVSVSYDAATKFASAEGGAATASSVGVGDRVYVVGRVGDDGVIAARVVKDEVPVGSGSAPIQGSAGVVTGSSPADKVFNVKLTSTGVTWSVVYTKATKVYRGSALASLADVATGDRVIVKGGENRQRYTIACSAIAIVPPAGRPASAAHPLKRIRPLDDLMQKRVKAGLGQLTEADFIKNQPAVEAEQN